MNSFSSVSSVAENCKAARFSPWKILRTTPSPSLPGPVSTMSHLYGRRDCYLAYLETIRNVSVDYTWRSTENLSCFIEL